MCYELLCVLLLMSSYIMCVFSLLRSLWVIPPDIIMCHMCLSEFIFPYFTSTPFPPHNGLSDIRHPPSAPPSRRGPTPPLQSAAPHKELGVNRFYIDWPNVSPHVFPLGPKYLHPLQWDANIIIFPPNFPYSVCNICVYFGNTLREICSYQLNKR